ncbi:hypothetical protein ACJJIX_09860 [Microbulbifer sp. VAAC004]|uniref:hypothetical protein n=1 Tax=unclassified Microbulbifer TaxID=2619833 RepID=UPI0040393D6B
MSVPLNNLLFAGVAFRLRIWVEANQWILIGLASIITPVLMMIHLPVSLLLTGEGGDIRTSLSILLVAHTVFAVCGILLSPEPTELKWYLSYFHPLDLIKSLCIVQLKYNPLFWALWLLPLLVLVYLGEPFSILGYLTWFFLFCSIQLFSFLTLIGLKYRQILFSQSRTVLLKKSRIVIRLLIAFSITIYCYVFAANEFLIALRILLIVGSSIIFTYAINSILEDEAEVNFWMMMKSCGKGGIVIQEYFKGILISMPGIMVVLFINGRESAAHFLIYMLAITGFSLLSLYKWGRVILAPLLAVSGMTLLSV